MLVMRIFSDRCHWGSLFESISSRQCRGRLSVDRTEVGKSHRTILQSLGGGVKLSKLVRIKTRGKVSDDLADVRDCLWSGKKSKELRTTLSVPAA